MSGLFFQAMRSHGSRDAVSDALGSFSFAELLAEIERVSAAFSFSGVMALMLENSAAWAVLDLACVQKNIPLVPLPHFFSDAQIAHVFAHAGVQTFITDNPSRVAHFFPDPPKEMRVAHRTVFCFSREASLPALPLGTAKITFTSGTTNAPKAVCLSVDAMMRVSQSLCEMLSHLVTERHVSVLPLSILLENIAGLYTSLWMGACVHFPALSYTAHDSRVGSRAPAFGARGKIKISKWGLPLREFFSFLSHPKSSTREPTLESRAVYTPEALHQMLFSTRATSTILMPEMLRMLVGLGKALPELRFAAVGGARVSPALLSRAREMGLRVYEGYGLSEAASVVTLNVPGMDRVGTVGKPLPHVALRIAEDGEIFIRDPLFSGYLSEASDVPEWYATGDLGAFTAEGFLQIHGRKKHVFITSFGRNVSPEWLESELVLDPVIEQACVMGEGLPAPIAILYSRVPERVPFALELVNDRLPDYARIRDFILATAPFSVANGQLTNTGRVRRAVIASAYSHTLSSFTHPMEVA